MIIQTSRRPAEGADTIRRADREERIVTCRYLRRSTLDRCTAEAADPDADILLCTHHLARVAVMLRDVAPGLIGTRQ